MKVSGTTCVKSTKLKVGNISFRTVDQVKVHYNFSYCPPA